ncbi:MAG: hypothetical protein E7510_11505 [Ruminococcus sp.]|nr:hypothetical protein [Ruminococcus sp.]
MMAQLFDEEVMRKQYDIASRRAEREAGRMENMISTAQALINMGAMSLENISLATGLPLEKVEELSKMKS